MFDQLMESYLDLFHQATEADEQARAVQGRRNYPEAAKLFMRASVLYAQAAKALLELTELCDAAERGEYQQGVDRLIAVSARMKAVAGELADRKEEPAPKADRPSVPNGDEDKVTFTPAAEKPNVSFDQIAGLTEAKQLVADEIINPMLYAEVYRRFGKTNQGGLLLFGPPGSGKTMMARAIAAESGMAFFSVKCSDIVGRYFGEAEKHVRDLFAAAREQKNAVIFMDEAEALACRRGGNSTVMNRLVPELLAQMDGFDKNEGHIIVIFATNRPYDLDPAFLRAGRLPTHCYIPLPDYEVRLGLLTREFGSRPCAPDLDLAELARSTDKFSCADLMNLINRTCQYPINRTIRCRNAGQTVVEELITAADAKEALRQVHASVEPAEIQRLEKWMKQMGIRIPAAA